MNGWQPLYPGGEGGVVSKEGRVKWFDSRKGQGVIQGEGTGELFFYISGPLGEENENIAAGHRVIFEVEKTKRAFEAVRVTRLG